MRNLTQKNFTLTERIFFWILPTLLVAVGVIGLLTYRSATQHVNSVYDAQLINNAGIMWMLFEDEISEGGLDQPREIDFGSDELPDSIRLSHNQSVHDYAESRMMRIWDKGRIIMYSDTAFPATKPAGAPGFSNTVFEGRAWRIFTMPVAKGSVIIEVGETAALRHGLVIDMLFDLVLPLVFLIPAIGLLVWAGIRKGISVIPALVGQISNRSSDDLSPVEAEKLPSDLVPLGQSLNLLMAKLEASLQSERRFADHAAHQLRTPLAALRLQLQMLMVQGDESERKSLLGDLLASMDKASRMVSQLLIAARVNHEEIDIRPVALYSLVASVAADMGAIVTSKNMNVSLDGDEAVTIRADENLLRLAVSNLLENALKYTPAGGKIELHVMASGGSGLFVIEDSGPGIAPEHREPVFKRFYRIDEPEVEGSGLGLAIVSEIVSRFSGSVTLKDADAGGLRVEILLPKE